MIRGWRYRMFGGLLKEDGASGGGSDAPFDFKFETKDGKMFLGGVELPGEAAGDLPETFDERVESTVGDERKKDEPEGGDEEDGEEAGRKEGSEEADGGQEGLLKDGEKEGGSKVEEPPAPAPLELKITFNGEELTLSGEDEIRAYAQKGKLFDLKNQQLAEMRSAVEPFFAINTKLKDDPAFLDYVQNYGNSEYVVDGPQPKVVTEAQVNQLVADKVAFLLEGEKAKWSHDAKYGAVEGIPKASEVHSQMLHDALMWDKFTREWVDSNPRAYQEKFVETFKKICAERGVVPDAAPIAPQKPAQSVADTLKQKEVAKETARVPGVQTTRPVPAEDGRRAYNKAVKQARATGDLADIARAIALSGSLPV